MLHYSDNTFMTEGTEHGYKKSIKRILTENYSDVTDYLKEVIPSKVMEFPKEVIDKYIEEIAFSVAHTISHLPNGIYAYTDSADPYIYHNIIAERITYGTIFLVSKGLLASLLKIITPEYVFHYIKGSIVLPNIKRIIEEVLAPKEKDNFNKGIEQDEALCRNVRSFLNAFIVNVDYTAAADILDRISEEVKNKEDLVRNEIIASKLCVPDIVYDLFFPDRERLASEQGHSYLESISLTVKELHTELSMNHSTMALSNILKKYSVKSSSDNLAKIDSTVKEIRAFRGFNDKNIYIDGISLEELQSVHRILDGSLLDDIDLSKYKNKTILENFRYIKKYFNINSDDIVLEDNVVKISRNGKVLYRFKYRDINMIKEFNSVFNIFGEKSDLIRETFNSNPANSFLTQTVIITDPKCTIASHKRSSSIPSNPLERVAHREQLISILKQKYKNDESVREVVAILENDPIYTLKYVKDIFRSTNYSIKNERQALFLALELQRLYKEALKDNIPDGLKNKDQSQESNKPQQDKILTHEEFNKLLSGTSTPFQLPKRIITEKDSIYNK